MRVWIAPQQVRKVRWGSYDGHSKMDQNLSNDVQDKTADISGSGRKPKFW